MALVDTYLYILRLKGLKSHITKTSLTTRLIFPLSFLEQIEKLIAKRTQNTTNPAKITQPEWKSRIMLI